MKFRSALVALLLLLSSYQIVFAQAFGFVMGTRIEELDVIQQIPGTANYRYAVVPPIPNPRLENYSAIVTPQDGLCQVAGATPTGDPERAEILLDVMKTALISVYGDGAPVSDREIIFWNTAPPVMAAALRIGRNGTTVIVEYVFTNYPSCSSHMMQLNETGL